MSRLFSKIYAPLFASDAMAGIFSDEATIQSMLDVEAALARVEAAAGIIPPEAAEKIQDCCREDLYRAKKLGKATAKAGNPVIPLIKALTSEAGDAGGFVHWGATSQDVADTGLVLQMRDALAYMDKSLREFADPLAGLAKTHRDDPMPGRTFMQQGLPITFGLKVAGWLTAILKHSENIARLRNDISVLQFAGAVGTLASLGDGGQRIHEALATELKLRPSTLSWHSDRRQIFAVGAGLAGLSASIGKIATDIALMAQTEVGELAEPAGKGRGGSSTMPQKRNPIGAVSVKASTAHVQSLLMTIANNGDHDHERASGGWHAEWLAIPDMFILTAGAIERVTDICSGLEVDTARMRANLDITNGTIMAEAVMMTLAPHMGRDAAHHDVADACAKALEQNKHLKEIMIAGPHGKLLKKAEWDKVFDPMAYTGQATANVDAVLARYNNIKS